MRHNYPILLLLLLPSILYASSTVEPRLVTATPYYSVRSQAVNLARWASGWTQHTHTTRYEGFNGTFSVTPEWSQSYNSDTIAHCLFAGDISGCNCPLIQVTGSCVSQRGETDWLADYFGLPRDFKSTLIFRPNIENFIIDFALHLSFDDWIPGLWLDIWAPFVRTDWELDFREANITKGVASHPRGYFNESINIVGTDSVGVPRKDLLQSATEFFSQKKSPDLGNNVLFKPLCASRFATSNECHIQSETGLADLHVVVGYDFLKTDEYHTGLGLIFAPPTGNRVKGEYLFEPIVGNGNHWSIGPALAGHVRFWRSENELSDIIFFFQANITHLFCTTQDRNFDLKGKPNSRYMLAQKMSPTVNTLRSTAQQNDLTLADQQGIDYRFANEFSPVANLTHMRVDVSIGAQADIVSMLSFTWDRLSLDVGYNLWARTCEKIKINCDCPIALKDQSWALKGDAHVYGFAAHTAGGITQDDPIALSGTQSKATMHSGTNNFSDCAGQTGGDPGPPFIRPTRNPFVDNAQFATAVSGNTATEVNDRVNPHGEQTKTSNAPILLSMDDIDFRGARTSGLSHKLFMHIEYSWYDEIDWTPYVGAGVEIEIGNNISFNKTSCQKACNDSCDALCRSACDPCKRCTVSQWGIWLKGGVTFY